MGRQCRSGSCLLHGQDDGDDRERQDSDSQFGLLLGEREGDGGFRAGFLGQTGQRFYQGAGEERYRFDHSGGFRPERYECGLFPGFRLNGGLYGHYRCRKNELQGAKNLGGQCERSLYLEL